MSLPAPLLGEGGGDEAVFNRRRGGEEKLKKLAFAAFFPEYALLPAFYAMGYYGWYKTALPITLFYVLGSCAFQYLVFRDHWKDKSAVPYPETLKGNLKTLLGVPVGCLGMPKWVYEFIAQAPNYGHVPQTAIVAGGAWSAWSAAAAEEWARRWRPVPLAGAPLAALGLPGALTAALALSFAVHCLGAVGFFTRRGRCSTDEERPLFDGAFDAANLLFLGKAFCEEGVQVSCFRAFALMSTKPSMAWLKVSVMSLSWGAAGAAERLNLLVAAVMGMYTVQPALAWLVGGLRGTWDVDVGLRLKAFFVACFACCNCCLLIPMVIITLHLLGVFVCKSHDLSVIHGCTAVVGVALNVTQR